MQQASDNKWRNLQNASSSAGRSRTRNSRLIQYSIIFIIFILFASVVWIFNIASGLISFDTHSLTLSPRRLGMSGLQSMSHAVHGWRGIHIHSALPDGNDENDKMSDHNSNQHQESEEDSQKILNAKCNKIKPFQIHSFSFNVENENQNGSPPPPYQVFIKSQFDNAQDIEVIQSLHVPGIDPLSLSLPKKKYYMSCCSACAKNEKCNAFIIARDRCDLLHADIKEDENKQHLLHEDKKEIESIDEEAPPIPDEENINDKENDHDDVLRSSDENEIHIQQSNDDEKDNHMPDDELFGETNDDNEEIDNDEQDVDDSNTIQQPNEEDNGNNISPPEEPQPLELENDIFEEESNNAEEPPPVPEDPGMQIDEESLSSESDIIENIDLFDEEPPKPLDDIKPIFDKDPPKPKNTGTLSIDELIQSGIADSSIDGENWDGLFPDVSGLIEQFSHPTDESANANENGEGNSQTSTSALELAAKAEAEAAAEAAREAEKMKEKPLTADESERLSKLSIVSYLPPGEYTARIKDPFYLNRLQFFHRFRPPGEIHDLMMEMRETYRTQQRYADLYLNTVNIGKSAEEKPIKVLQFGNPFRGKHVVIVAGLRGCDWIGPLASLHSATTMVGRATSVSEPGEGITKLLDAVRFHFIILSNPDGYLYSRHKTPANARQWCNNRRVSGGGHGVDLERNFGVDGVSWGFGLKGKEARKDKMGFQGLSAFSEPETKTIREYIKNLATGRGRLAVLHVRCCNGAVAPPQKYEKANPEAGGEDEDGGAPKKKKKRVKHRVDVDAVAKMMAEEMRKSESTDFSVAKRDQPFSVTNTGRLIDWAHGECFAELAFELELKAR